MPDYLLTVVVVVEVVAAVVAIIFSTYTRMRVRRLSLRYSLADSLSLLPHPASDGLCTYTGDQMLARIVFHPIADCLDIAYHYDASTEIWEQVVSDTMLKPGMMLAIKLK